MKKNKHNYFAFSVFIPTLLLIVGINMFNLMIYIGSVGVVSFPVMNAVLMTVYWIISAYLLTLLIRYNTIRQYEHPMQIFAEATSQVAKGDFSVYVEPIHSPDKQDYIDFMINDFNKMVEELGSVETLKTDFFSNVSHEIKTPLTVIQNYAELLKSKNLTEEERLEYANSISESSQRLASLITNILKLNKLEKQSITPNKIEYDLCEQLCLCVIGYEHLWEQKNIEIDMDIEDKRIITTDPELMEIVWNNLLSNAVKFTGIHGKITIRQHIDNHRCIVEISDTGCGMDEKTLKHIFEKFYQGDTSHSQEGNGLGLALVNRIIQIVGGDISARSELNKGTTFIVSLPIDEHSVEVNEYADEKLYDL